MSAVDWFITRFCYSKKCPFCYAPYEKFGDDATYQEAEQICEEIIKKNIEYVTICGGEPLLFNGIEKVVKKLKKAGVKVILYSGLITKNAYKKIIEMSNDIYMLSLPVEAVNDNIVSRLRGTDTHEQVFEILDYFKKSNNKYRPKIKIGTVVNAINILDMENLTDKLLDYTDVITTWRLYMFSPYGIGEKINHCC